MEDSRIVALFWDRDSRAIEETAVKYGNYCQAIARRILQNQEDAEEAVSDAYLAAWTSIPPHKPAVLSTYIGKLTRRTALKRWEAGQAQKRGGGEMPLALDELAACIPNRHTPEQALESRELTRILNDFLKHLDAQERRVFVCRYWYLDPVADIAKRFGFSESKVKSMLLRTRKKLKAALNKEGISI